MKPHRPKNVVTAFEILLEEIEAEIDFTNNVGARAFAERDYDRARQALDQAAQISTFRDKLVALRQDWDQIISQSPEKEQAETEESRRNLGRLKHGQRTPENEYYSPILRVLVRKGGSGQTSEVLEEVRQEMADILGDVDYEHLASGPNYPRWKNASQWARNSLVRMGLLKDDSPRGVWEISEKGRQYIKMNE
ncbi:winged helix-turn-helix domain-containing protein [candidate division CSSED10-310 bacterium]|uniref:Winged helix-turn-helix domain-containing protein n=1 Tax=candidate division CSSED10-310 bacterium TaxID=2855610 RepID=A0ABV6YXR0_UNCC1